MEVESKYKLGDEVWLIDANKCLFGVVVGIQYTYGIGRRYGGLYSGKEDIRIWYSIETKQRDFLISDVNEERLFPTKEELLKSL